MWTAATRAQHSCAAGQYPSSLSDAQWNVISTLFPAPPPTGRRPVWPLRLLLDAVLYVLRSGIPWRALPREFPPWQTVYWHFRSFVDGCLFERINQILTCLDRELAGGEASPTAAVMDSQTVKATEAPGVRGYDGGKKINGQKRHILVDTDGRLLLAGMSAAGLHDSHGGAALIAGSRPLWPFLARVYADSAYAGARVAAASPCVAVEVVKRSPDQKGFAVQRRRWVVERTFAWIGRSRRLWRCCEVRDDVATSFVYAAAAVVLIKRIARAKS